MLFIQDQIMLNAIAKVIQAKARYLVKNARPLTVFLVGSYVFAKFHPLDYTLNGKDHFR